MSGLLIRAITFKSKTIMLPLYKAFVRSILEYANPVWFPHKRKDIDMIEDVQRHFTCTVIGLRDLDYHQRLESLKLPSLEYRRVRENMIELYKICQRIYDPATTHTLVNFVPQTSTTRSHPYKLSKVRVNTTQFQYFFTNRIINLWNSLPDEIVTAESVNSFKNGIDSHLKEYMFSTGFNLYY